MAETIYRKLKDLNKLPNNPRTILDDDFKRLCDSVQNNADYFKARPLILSDRTGELVIIAGNQRYEAAKRLKFKEVPTHLIENLTEEREREIIIRDNVANGQWDFDAIANEWSDLPLEDWGLDIPDFEAIEDAGEHQDAEAQIDKAAELNKVWEVKHGDLWTIGDSFLLCGDSTKAEDVARVLNGAKPNLMITDPPYGVEYDADWRNHSFRADGSPTNGRAIGKVTNDDNCRWLAAYELFAGNVAYIWCASQRSTLVHADIIEAGFIPNYQIIWNKSCFAIGRGDYHWKHEPCWYATRKGSKHYWIGNRSQTTVWDIAKPQKSETGHSTQKPLECMARPMQNHEGDVYEPFAGSGTTLVAAQNLNRKCYAIEISENYCAVILQRMTDAFPDLEIKRISQSEAANG